jgi:hypothetical protein
VRGAGRDRIGTNGLDDGDAAVHRPTFRNAIALSSLPVALPPMLTPEACREQLSTALRHSPTVKFMVDALAKAGCPVDSSFFSVETCQQQVVGGFRPGDGVRPTLPARVRSPLVAHSPVRAGGDVSQPHAERHRV